MKIATQKQKSWKLLALKKKKNTTPAISCEAAQLSVPVLKKCACCMQEFSIRCVRICYLTPGVCFGFVWFCFVFLSVFIQCPAWLGVAGYNERYGIAKPEFQKKYRGAWGIVFAHLSKDRHLVKQLEEAFCLMQFGVYKALFYLQSHMQKVSFCFPKFTI